MHDVVCCTVKTCAKINFYGDLFMYTVHYNLLCVSDILPANYGLLVS